MMPPGTSTLPVTWKSAMMACPAGSASFVMSTATPHCSVAGLLAARMRAALRMRSAGTHVVVSAYSGVNGCTCSRSSSKP